MCFQVVTPRCTPTAKELTIMRAHSGRWRPAAVTLGAALLMVSACAKSEDSNSGTSAAPASGGPQGVDAASDGTTCSIDKHGGTMIDLQAVKVGFSQS